MCSLKDYILLLTSYKNVNGDLTHSVINGAFYFYVTSNRAVHFFPTSARPTGAAFYMHIMSFRFTL